MKTSPCVLVCCWTAALFIACQCSSLVVVVAAADDTLGQERSTSTGSTPPPYQDDPRYIGNGSVIFEYGYLDQPYCQHTNDGAWACVITGDAAHEGGNGEHMIATVSKDQGATWSTPVSLEPTAMVDNSYGVLAKGYNGRLYCMYNMNLDNVTKLPNGKSLGRTDELGFFVMKYSDDGGYTWSAQRYNVPYPEAPIDRANSFNGKVRIMWSVDQAKVHDGKVMYAFTRIGTYPQGPPEEIWFLQSPNMLTEPDASKVTWESTPNGAHGLQVPPPGTYADSIIEEGHLVPLGASAGSGFYAMARTNLGYLAAANNAGTSTASGWSNTSFARFWTPGTGALKNPRGPITPKQFANGMFLLLWYFNSETGYDDAGSLLPGAGPPSSRMPYWLSSGVKASTPAGPSILWSQPEIIIYDREFVEKRGPGYPDFIQEPDGSVYITETQKTIARVHRVPHDLLQGLWTQQTANRLALQGLTVNITESQVGHSVPAPTLPTFTQYARVGQGLAITAWVSNHGAATAGQVLLDGRRSGSASGQLKSQDAAAAGIVLSVGAGNSVVLNLTDSSGTTVSWATDPTCSKALLQGWTGTVATAGASAAAAEAHHLAFVVDGGPLIVTVAVDGVLCDGGPAQARGWTWFTDALGDVNGASSWAVAPNYGGTLLGGRVYAQRYLRTSEVVGNFRAGPVGL